MGGFHAAGRKNGTRPARSNGEAARFAAENDAKGNDAHLGPLFLAMHDGRLRKILQMIESGSPHKIHDLALECNLSHSHLQHLFKQHTGLGLGRMLTEQKLHRAADLLGRTSMSIKEIAWAVGYEHTSSFTRAFERHFRQSPRRYRQTQELNRILTSERVG